jgi:uncharacterized lipoprotein
MINKTLRYCTTLLLIALVSACAQSPQRINVQPTLSVKGDPIGSGRAILVSAADERPNKVLGTLGGVYSSTATLMVGNNIEQALTGAANALLAAQGYVVNSPDPSALQLTIVVESLTYLPQEQPVGSDVKLAAVLRAEVSKQGETFSGRYQSNAERRSVTRPDQRDNEKYVNALLSETLERMFDDNRLRDFLMK